MPAGVESDADRGPDGRGADVARWAPSPYSGPARTRPARGRRLGQGEWFVHRLRPGCGSVLGCCGAPLAELVRTRGRAAVVFQPPRVVRDHVRVGLQQPGEGVGKRSLAPVEIVRAHTAIVTPAGVEVLAPVGCGRHGGRRVEIPGRPRRARARGRTRRSGWTARGLARRMTGRQVRERAGEIQARLEAGEAAALAADPARVCVLDGLRVVWQDVADPVIESMTDLGSSAPAEPSAAARRPRRPDPLRPALAVRVRPAGRAAPDRSAVRAHNRRRSAARLRVRWLSRCRVGRASGP